MTEKNAVFQAPAIYVAVFYGLLVVWTIGTVPVIYQKFQRGGFSGDWLFAVMIAFFYLYSWYWALGLFYRITVDAEGRIQLKSLRRTLEISAEEVHTIEGSKLPGGFGFIKMKVNRESAYLFCLRMDPELEEIFREIRRLNPFIRTARI